MHHTFLWPVFLLTRHPHAMLVYIQMTFKIIESELRSPWASFSLVSSTTVIEKNQGALNATMHLKAGARIKSNWSTFRRNKPNQSNQEKGSFGSNLDLLLNPQQFYTSSKANISEFLHQNGLGNGMQKSFAENLGKSKSQFIERPGTVSTISCFHSLFSRII